MSQLPLHCHRQAPGEPLDYATIDPVRWFDDLAEQLPPSDLERAWGAVQRGLRRAFPNAHIQSGPTTTGANAIESRLPWPPQQAKPPDYPALPHELQVRLHTQAGQHRQAVYTQPGTTSRELVIYDRRLSYGAHFRHVPTLLTGVQHDTGSEYLPFRRGWYAGRATVPADWAHIGLLPTLAGGKAGWQWPDTPGATFEGFWNWREVRLALDHDWHVEISERILFDPPGISGEDPLRPFRAHLGALLDQVEAARPSLVNRAIRNALRHCLINPVGLFHHWPRTLLGEFTPETAPPNDGDLTFDPLPDGRWRVFRFAPPERFPSRWHRPEWSAEIYAAARVAATRAALAVPREQLVAIYADALFLTADPHWPDGGKIGDLRYEHTFTRSRPRPVPTSLTALWDIKEAREEW